MCCGVRGWSSWEAAAEGFGDCTFVFDVVGERNRRIFQDSAQSIARLEAWFLGVLYSWVSRRANPDLFALLDFVDNVVG